MGSPWTAYMEGFIIMLVLVLYFITLKDGE